MRKISGYVFFTLCIVLYGFIPPEGGVIVVNKYHLSIPVHQSNYSTFLGASQPDSAIFIFRQPKACEPPKDSLKTLFEIKGEYIYSSRKSWYDFVRDSSLNLQLIRRLMALNDAVCFRAFYRNASGEVYKYQDINFRNNKIRELVLTDKVSRSVEEQKFYESGRLAGRTQYSWVERDSLEKKRLDSLWFDIKPKLVKTGREEIYYPNQALRMARVYLNGVLKDSTYSEFYPDGKVRKSYSTKAGQLNGAVKTFGKRGQLLEFVEYENGKLTRTQVAKTEFEPNKKAFLFGIDKYTPPPTIESTPVWKKMKWGDLRGCVNDVNLLRSVLSSREGFNPANIYSVTDEEATREKALAAFDNFPKTLNKGDIVFVHFSAHGHVARNLPDSLSRYAGLFIPCRDANYPADSALSRANYIFQYQTEEFLDRIKKQIGKTGQLVISIDVSQAGELLSFGKTDTAGKKQEDKVISSRGESNNILFNLVKDESSSVVIFSASSSEEDGMEMKDDAGKYFGAYSLALARVLESPMTLNSMELFEEVVSYLRKKSMRQTPGYLANETQYLFEGSDTRDNAKTDLPPLKPAGNCYMLSVGISDYRGSNIAGRNGNEKGALRFSNCEADAAAYADFFGKQFEQIRDESADKTMKSTLLTSKGATRENILAAINNAISNCKPEDYFIFNFSGYCKPLRDSGGKQVTYFVPYSDLFDISDTVDLKKYSIPLNQLKDLFQLIPANNQLFITEAGSTDDFQKEFIQALIETSPTIASLSNKNRIFLVPRGSGLDKFMCNGISQEHGPLNYCVTSLPDELNIFGLFEGGVWADAVKFALHKTEVGCDYFRTDYFDIFFEREFISSLRYFLPEDVMKSRGGKFLASDQAALANTISKKYALVVGTNHYEGKPVWSDLDGVPTLDATDIAKELEKNYGFQVKLLLDKPSDSIYEQVLRLSKILQPNDQLILYFAGHGDYDSLLFDDGFIVCTNSRTIKEDPYRNTYIQYSKLSRMINKLPSKQIMMVLDVCFGGTFDERVARNRSRSKGDEYADLAAESYLAEKLKVKTRLYLTSGGKKEVPNGYKGSHSPFAQRFLQCLQTRGGTGKILTATNFHEFVKMLPSGPLLGSFGDDDIGSEFVILAK